MEHNRKKTPIKVERLHFFAPKLLLIKFYTRKNVWHAYINRKLASFYFDILIRSETEKISKVDIFKL